MMTVVVTVKTGSVPSLLQPFLSLAKKGEMSPLPRSLPFFKGKKGTNNHLQDLIKAG